MLLFPQALNEFDCKLSGNVDWRQKIETQTGTVLATEAKNNAGKIARYTFGHCRCPSLRFDLLTHD
jgi:hypothetical protein